MKVVFFPSEEIDDWIDRLHEGLIISADVLSVGFYVSPHEGKRHDYTREVYRPKYAHVE